MTTRPYDLYRLAPHFYIVWERGGLSVNVSDSRPRGRGFEPHSGQTVLCP